MKSRGAIPIIAALVLVQPGPPSWARTIESADGAIEEVDDSIEASVEGPDVHRLKRDILRILRRIEEVRAGSLPVEKKDEKIGEFQVQLDPLEKQLDALEGRRGRAQSNALGPRSVPPIGGPGIPAGGNGRGSGGAD
jgi:hypothetical protein